MNLFLQNLIDAIAQGGVFALTALGIALIFGIMGLINFAHGELIMLGAYTIYLLSDLPWPIYISAGLIVPVFVALIMERVAFRPVRDASPWTLLLVSMAVSVFAQGLVRFIAGSQAKAVSLPTAIARPLEIAGLRISRVNLLAIGLTIVLLTGLAVFLKRTKIGVQMRAAAEDLQMARVLGVRADRVIPFAFAVSGLLAGVVTVVRILSSATLEPSMGLTPLLVGFVATVIGGMGRLGGAALGGFVLGFITVALQAWLPLEVRQLRQAFVFAAVIAILLLRPQGILGMKAGRRI